MQDKKPDTITLDEDNLVVVPTPKYVKDSIEEHAQSRNHPNATLEDKGFVILSNDVGSDSETNAATPKAVKAAYDLANTANRNADTRLAKDQNGADIPNKEEFVKNIGLGESAYVQFLQVTTKSLIIRSDSPWGGVSAYRPNGTYWRIEGNPDDASALLNFIDRNPDNSNRSVQSLPKGFGTLLSLGANCWRDGNGFIKLASPIIIHPDGSFITNDESEGATVTKLGLGHYKISGILGYNADGAWGVHGGISVPRDVNGNELVYVDDKVCCRMGLLKSR